MRPNPNYELWTREEMDTLEAAWRKGGMAAARAALPHRTPDSLRGKVGCLGIHKDGRQPYTKLSGRDREWVDAALRREYRNGRPDLGTLARQLSKPKGLLKSRASALGLTRKKENAWTDEEQKLLQDLVERGYAVRTVYKRFLKEGYKRSLSAIVSRVSKTRIGWHRDFLSPSEVAEMFGCDMKTVLTWVRAGWLKATRAPGLSSVHEVADERLLWHIHYANISEFMTSHPGRWDHRTMRQEVLLDLLCPDKLNVTARKEMG